MEDKIKELHQQIKSGEINNESSFHNHLNCCGGDVESFILNKAKQCNHKKNDVVDPRELYHEKEELTEEEKKQQIIEAAREILKTQSEENNSQNN